MVSKQPGAQGAGMALPRRRTPEDGAEQQAGGHDSGADWHAFYEIENPAEVDAYVRRHPSLASVLAEAPDQVRNIFDEVPHLVVRHEADEDGEPAGDGLVVDILTGLDADDTQDRLARLDDRWWLVVLPRIVRDGASVVFVPRFV